MSEIRYHCYNHSEGVYHSRSETCPVCEEIKRLNAKAIELVLEVERLKAKKSVETQVVRCDSAATSAKLSLNAETIRNQAATNTEQSETIDELTVACAKIRTLFATVEDLLSISQSTTSEPECETCVGDPSSLVCPACRGGVFGCHTCGGSGKVKKCGDCGKKVGS